MIDDSLDFEEIHTQRIATKLQQKIDQDFLDTILSVEKEMLIEIHFTTNKNPQLMSLIGASVQDVKEKLEDFINDKSYGEEVNEIDFITIKDTRIYRYQINPFKKSLTHRIELMTA